MATKDHFHGWQGRRWCDVEERAAWGKGGKGGSRWSLTQYRTVLQLSKSIILVLKPIVTWRSHLWLGVHHRMAWQQSTRTGKERNVHSFSWPWEIVFWKLHTMCTQTVLEIRMLSYMYIYMSFGITVYRLFAEDCCLKSNFPQHFSDPNGTRGCWVCFDLQSE